MKTIFFGESAVTKPVRDEVNIPKYPAVFWSEAEIRLVGATGKGMLARQAKGRQIFRLESDSVALYKIVARFYSLNIFVANSMSSGQKTNRHFSSGDETEP